MFEAYEQMAQRVDTAVTQEVSGCMALYEQYRFESGYHKAFDHGVFVCCYYRVSMSSSRGIIAKEARAISDNGPVYLMISARTGRP